MRCRMSDNARLLSAPTARTRIGGHRDGSTHPQLEALQTRLEALHASQLISDDELFVLEDCIADFFEVKRSFDVVTLEIASTNHAVGKMHLLVLLTEGVERDAPFARQLEPDAADLMLEAVRDAGIGVMVFVGNRGCIQIHSGPIQKLKAMGPWQNVMDPGFNLHLRRDKVAELWAVEKPTQRGPAISVEAFDADGAIIFQVFGIGKEGMDSRPEWGRIVEALPSLPAVAPAGA